MQRDYCHVRRSPSVCAENAQVGQIDIGGLFVYCGAVSAPDHISTTDTRGTRGNSAVRELRKPGALEQKRLEMSRNNQRKSGRWLRIVGVVGSNPIRSTKKKSTCKASALLFGFCCAKRLIRATWRGRQKAAFERPQGRGMAQL